MATTFAELNARVLEGLGNPDNDLCSLSEVHSANVSRHNTRASMAKASDTNTILSVSANFTPTTVQHNITSLIEKGVPAFLEITRNGRFVPARVVSYNELYKNQLVGEIVCAFYGNDAGLQFVAFNEAPSVVCRIQYDADTQKVLMASVSSIPDTVSDLIVLEAQNHLIPRIKLKLAQAMSRSEQAKEELQPVFQALSEIYTQNMMELPDLVNLWSIWAFRDKGAQTNIERRHLVGRYMYGDF